MKNRVKKRLLYARFRCAVLLPRHFVKGTLRGISEARAGVATPYLPATKVRIKVRPIRRDLSGAEGTHIVLNTARRVMEKHAAVIKALANR